MTTKHIKFKKNKIQHLQKHVRILKNIETLINLTCSIVIMTSSDYGPDSINKYIKTFIKSSCENYYSILLNKRSHIVLNT